MLSRQIRPPIYSLKQTKLRKRRVIRYAILYFVLLVVFLVLIVGPVIITKFNVLKSFKVKVPMDLLQPTGLNNNDTLSIVTGTCIGGKCPLQPGVDAQATGDAAARLARFLAF